MSEPNRHAYRPEVMIASTDEAYTVGNQHEPPDVAVRFNADVVPQVAVIADLETFWRPHPRPRANMKIDAEIPYRSLAAAQAISRCKAPQAGGDGKFDCERHQMACIGFRLSTWKPPS